MPDGKKKMNISPRIANGLRAARRRTDRAEDKCRDALTRWRLPIFLLAVTLLAFFGRMALWPVVSGDFTEFLHLWLNEVRAAQGFRSLHLQIGNYTAPYHYLMAAMSYIPGLDNLHVIKISSTAADFCMGGAAALLLLRLGAKKWQAAVGYAILLCVPTVFLNSAAWGQCDAMYTTLILLFFAAWLGGHRAFALFLYGLALTVKLQAIFVLPAVLIYWLCGQLRLRHLLCGALGYFAMFIPAMLAAGSFEPLWRAYAMQTKVSSLSSNISNGASLFTGFIEDELAMINSVLVYNCIIILGALAIYCWQYRKDFSHQSAFILLMLCACLAPYLLPAMRDRYYYVAEVLTVLYAVRHPRRMAIPLALQAVSLPSYMLYLQHQENPFGRWLALVAALPAALLFLDLRRSFKAPDDPHWSIVA